MEKFRCEGIRKDYDGVPVVKDITLTLKQRELGCLLGPSGVGKTTLMSVLSGVDKPDAGDVYLEGENITGKPGRVSYMLQKDLLLPFKTILDNISLPLRLCGMNRRQARRNAAEHLEEFGLGGHGEKYPHQLSGGMRQRAALLRTYLTGNDVMMLDEPFSALDAITKRQMHSWFREMKERLDLSAMLITHDIDEALTLADKIYILTGSPGRITMQFAVDAPYPRTTEFAISEQFLIQKKAILAAIE